MKKNYTRLPLDQPNPAVKGEMTTWLPLLNVRVGFNHKQTPRIPAIVDSGSQCCLFKADLAEYLGIDLKRGIEGTMGGLSHGMREPVYYHEVKLYIESDWVIDITAGFIKRLSIAGILGRNGFFDNFKVKFDQSMTPSVLEIERIDKLQ